MSGFLTNISISLENLVGAQLQRGEYRIGIVDLESVSELQPLNQKFEVLILQCKKCGKSTAYLSMQRLDNYIDVEKKSVIQCRHCQVEVQIPKIQQVRETQGEEIDFLQLQDWQFTKIISKKGHLTEISKQNRKIQLEYSQAGEKQLIEVAIPKTKLNLLIMLQMHQRYRFKVKVFESKLIDPQKAFLQKTVQNQIPSVTTHKYELISLSKAKR